MCLVFVSLEQAEKERVWKTEAQQKIIPGGEFFFSPVEVLRGAS